MAALSPVSREPPLLLFCDTFSHQENEEMHLDLVSFPRPVSIEEVRVIPVGHRVHAAISDREKVGETHPPSFKLDMFIRNLDNPGAVVFERLGVLDYKEPNNFQITASVKAATDVVVLRGWYTSITISLYGYFKELSRTSVQDVRQEPHTDRPSVIMEQRQQDRAPEDLGHEKSIERPERGYQRTYDRPHERGYLEKGLDRAERHERSFERGPYERGLERTERSSRGSEPRDEYEGRRLDDDIRSRDDERVRLIPRKTESDSRQRILEDEARGRSMGGASEEGRKTRGRGPDDVRQRRTDIEGRSRRYLDEEERMRGRSKDRTPVRSPPPKKQPSRDSPSKVIATVGESTADKPTTPPESPMEEAEETNTRSGSPSDDLFEPLTPDHSPTNMFLSDECIDDEEQDAYEEILSDEEDMALDEGGLDETSVQFDLDLYSEDAWMSVSVSFNPYQCDLSPLTSFPPPDQTEHDAALHKFKDAATTETAKDTGEKLVEQVELCKVLDRNTKWVEVFEEIPPLIIPGLAYIMRTKEDSDVILTKFVEWTTFALNVEEAMKLPIAVNVRLLKAGLRMVYALCSCGPEIAALLINAGVQEKLHTVLTTEHMSSSMKLHTLQALDSCTDSHICVEHFLSWDTASLDDEDNIIDIKEENTQSGYQKLVEFLLTDQTVRVVNAASALTRKVHLYELLASFQNTVERVMTTTAETAATASEFEATESESEPGTESKDQKVSSISEYSMEISTANKTVKDGPASIEDIELITVALDEIYTILKKAPELVVQPPIKAFPTTAKITAIDSAVKDPYPVLFRFFAVRRLLESIVVLMSSPLGCHPVVYCGVRDLIFLLLQTQRGLLFLSSHPDTVSGLIRVLTQTTETDIHHSEAPPLHEFLRNSTTADLCTPQHLGLLLIYHLQALQAVDQLKTSLSTGISGTDLDGADTLSTLHTLYSMTFTMIGKAAVVSVMSMDDNLASLLPFVEPTGVPADDVKLKKCVSSRYASVLILLTIKSSEDVKILSKLGPRLVAITEKLDAESPLAELTHWLDPIKEITFDMSSIVKLVQYVQSKLSQINSSPTVACGVLMAMRILKHLVCPVKDDQQKSQGYQKDLTVNLSCIQLFSANAMDVFINTLQKVGEFVLHPWRKGQPLGTGHPLVTISMATPLLALLKIMLTELLNTGSYQFKDTRLMTSLMLLHTVMCSAPMTGQLNNLAQQIQRDIVAIFMTFTRPVVQSSDHEEAINESIWSLMLKELFKYITSTPQAFLGGLVLLSELLPIPLPMHTLEDLNPEDVTQVMNHRLLWSAHLNPLSSDLQGILKSLAVSACHNLQQVLRRVCSQLADLSAPTAFNIVRTLLEVLDTEMSKQRDDKKTCTADAVRIMALLAFLSSQPAVKISLLQLLKISRAGKNDDVMFPNLLPSMLALLSAEPDALIVSRAQYCIVSIIQSLCDPSVSLTSFVTPYTNQHLSNTLPDSEMLSVICTALLDHVGSVQQAFATILLALRSMVTLTEHNYGVYHLKRALEKNKEVFHRLMKRLSSSFETGIPGPDSLSTLSTTTELLQLLLPEEATNIGETQETTPPPEDITEGQEVKPDPTSESEDAKPESTGDSKPESDPSIKPDPDKPVKQEIKSEELGQAFPNAGVTLKKGELFGVFDVEELKPTSEISVSVAQMKTFLKADNEEEFTLKVLEKRLEESCKEDETLETLLEGITTLKQILEKGEETTKEPEEDKEPDLPSSLPFQQLFNNRITFIAGDPEDGGVSPTMWFSTPPPEDIEPETDMVNSDLDSLRTKYCPDFDLKAELEKGLVPSPPSSPIRKKSRVVKRKFDPLISDASKDFKRFRGGYQGRGGRGGSRGMGRGRGRGGMGDMFRSRKQNTSRPPSMHVDDFMAMEQQNLQSGNKGQENIQNRRGGMKGPMTNRPPMDRGGTGFMGNQQRWGTNLSTPFRKGPGPQGVGGRGGAGGTPDWTGQRQFGGFPGQRGFQRGPNWSNPQSSQQYRGGGMRENQYNRPQGRGYWDTPRTNKAADARFMPSPNVGPYRPGTGRGYQGRHLRSFTR